MDALVKLFLIFMFTKCTLCFDYDNYANSYGQLIQEFEGLRYVSLKQMETVDWKNIIDIKELFQDDLIKDNAKHIANVIEMFRTNADVSNWEVKRERYSRAAESSSSITNMLINILENIKLGDLLKGGNDTERNILAILSGLTPDNPSTNLMNIALQNNPSFASAVPEVLSSQLANSTMTMLYMLSTAVSNAPSQCASDLTQMFKGIATGEDWALSMLDAFGRPPAGLKSFRTKWLGDFDQCQAVDTASIKGQYCKASIYVSGLSIAKGVTTMIEEGVCMPSSCQAETVKGLLAPVLIALSKSLTNNIGLYVNKVECKHEDMELDGKAVAMTIVCSGLLIILIVATLFDIYITRKMKSATQNPKKEGMDKSKKYDTRGAKFQLSLPQLGKLERALLAFSIYTNGKKLLSTKKSAGSLTAIHGIRFLSMSWVILGHTLSFQMIFDNFYVVALEWVTWPSFQVIMNALVSVDSFFTLSGLLVSYMTFKETKKLGGALKINWGIFYFHRFWRLTPVYMLILGMYTCFTKYLADGPNYNQKDLEGCTEKWWTNLLYINNFVYYDDQPAGCIGQSWYLANDMQFYILSPLIMVPFYIHPLLGGIASFVFLGATWGTTAGLGMKYSWPPTQLGGGVVDTNRSKMFTEYYIKPYGRMGPYIMGLITGYILYRTKCKCRMKWFVAVFGWIVATVIACLVLYGLHDAFNGHPLSVEVSVFYHTVHRTVWGACVCWVVFACATGNGGFINTLLSWEPFIPLGRLTYCAFLLHPIVMEIYVGSLRHPVDLSIISLTFLYIAYLFSSLVFAFIISLAFESPMMALEKVMFVKDKKEQPIHRHSKQSAENPMELIVNGTDVSNGKLHPNTDP